MIFAWNLGDLHEHIESFFDLPVQQHNMNGREDSQKNLPRKLGFKAKFFGFAVDSDPTSFEI